MAHIVREPTVLLLIAAGVVYLLLRGGDHPQRVPTSEHWASAQSGGMRRDVDGAVDNGPYSPYVVVLDPLVNVLSTSRLKIWGSESVQKLNFVTTARTWACQHRHAYAPPIGSSNSP